MEVYRIVHKRHNHGPYRVPCLIPWANNLWLLSHELGNSHCDLNHPEIWDDLDDAEIPVFCRKQYLSGFESMDQLKHWFSPWWLTRLAQAGYVIKKYKATKVFKGTYQVAFKTESRALKIIQIVPENL